MAFTTVTGSNGVTSLVGTSGIDVATIVTLASNVFVGAQEANDNLTVDLATGGNVVTGYTVNGGAGSDTITFADSILNSTINADGGTGTAGNDTLAFFGTAINSAVSAGSGNDIIASAADALVTSNSTVNGNAGVDVITLGNTANSAIYGGQDTDTITLFGREAFALDEVTNTSTSSLINGNKGSDTIQAVTDIVNPGGFSLTAMSIYGGNGNDTINFSAVASGTSGSFFSGDLGDDTIVATAGTDTVQGGSGGDFLTGGLKGDTLTGGADGDGFIFGSNSSLGTSSAGFDSITDFATTASSSTTDFLIFTGLLDTDYLNIGDVVTSSSTDLATNVASAVNFTTLAPAAQYGVIGLTLTPGSSGANFAGNYLAVDINNNGGAFQSGTDLIIKINTLSGVAGVINI